MHLTLPLPYSHLCSVSGKQPLALSLRATCLHVYTHESILVQSKGKGGRKELTQNHLKLELGQIRKQRDLGFVVFEFQSLTGCRGQTSLSKYLKPEGDLKLFQNLI